MSVEIVYETHSLSVDNERGFGTGSLDRERARELGERRRDDGIAAVFTSDPGRAIETVEIALGGSASPFHDRAARMLLEVDLEQHPAEVRLPLEDVTLRPGALSVETWISGTTLTW